MFDKSYSDTHCPVLRAVVSETERNVDRTLTQCEKFDRMFELLQDWADDWSASAMRRTLFNRSTPEELKEQALVGLVHQGTAKAARLLEQYRPTDASVAHRRFVEIVHIEWGRQNPSIRLEAGARKDVS